jgi:hypothetical protein
MTRIALFRLLLWAALATFSAGSTCCISAGLAVDENPPAKTTEKSKVPKGRLPPHYAKVVTQQQREKIYLIQGEYRTKIETARAQLDALLKEEKAKISAVLTDEQKKKVEEFQTAAKSKYGTEKADAQKIDTDKTSSPPVSPVELNEDK